ncbi:M1 family metallopeptidase [Acidicapsa ligni]|uniref:M1 family metallopeptidase n=1 Tax=Acidicapsa ligni TaxID=542300 RepID=UPI0021E01857|nr:M1 family aminopeptidase [Acidicapsa ligni]
MNFRRLRVFAFVATLIFIWQVRTADSQQQPNTNATYHQLRTLLPGPATIVVDNFTLKRDSATFTFTHGEFALFGEVNGKVTGAVFGGTGHFHLTPPTTVERHNLQILTKKSEFDEDFTRVVLRFSDKTADELRKAAVSGKQAQPDSSLVQAATEFHTFQREHLFENIDLRLLEDVLSPAPSAEGGFFLAAIKGSTDSHLIFEIDPHGAPVVTPEEVRLSNWNQWGWTFPSAFHLASEYTAGTDSSRQENTPFHVESEDLDTTIEKSGFLGGVATVHLHALEDGLAVVPLELFPTLRVSHVEGEHGEALDFVQEKREEDADFAVVLATPLKKNDTAILKITYGGKDAVVNRGGDNYDPIARENWFPNGGTSFGSYSRYKMRFHSPKETSLIATGDKLSDKVDGKSRITEWDSMTPLPVAGFHLGLFVEKDGKTPDGLAVSAYANSELPSWAQGVRNAANDEGMGPQLGSHMSGMAVGNLNTTGMLPATLSQGTVAAQIYTNYFGKLPFDHLALSQQPACDFGQSWPMLVYLPICGFWDQTIQNQFGLNPADPYWKTVTAHEVAHQWWGHTVGFMSYRDQWMSEGFADASASIFLQKTRKTPNDFRDFWKQLKTQLTDRNADGFRPIDVGPVTMGSRLSSPKTGWSVYQNLVYPKGAYILHMVRMMMFSSKTGDADFIAMMHDFVDTYRLKVATTEDFKAMLEKHMTPGMDLDHNHKMDWFFNEYVYGTDLPQYHFETQLKENSDEDSLYFKLTQSGVPESFKMLVPVYLELSDGRAVRMGTVTIIGNQVVEKTIRLAKPPVAIKKVSIDYMHDVLAVEN